MNFLTTHPPVHRNFTDCYSRLAYYYLLSFALKVLAGLWDAIPNHRGTRGTIQHFAVAVEQLSGSGLRGDGKMCAVIFLISDMLDLPVSRIPLPVHAVRLNFLKRRLFPFVVLRKLACKITRGDAKRLKACEAFPLLKACNAFARCAEPMPIRLSGSRRDPIPPHDLIP